MTLRTQLLRPTRIAYSRRRALAHIVQDLLSPSATRLLPLQCIAQRITQQPMHIVSKLSSNLIVRTSSSCVARCYS